MLNSYQRNPDTGRFLRTLFSFLFFLSLLGNEPLPLEAQDLSAPEILTNASQFQGLSSQDCMRGRCFHLTGTVTMIDTNRDLLVLQDSTGAIAINVTNNLDDLKVGLLVSISSENGSPYVPSFPDYPYRPSGWAMQKSFEAPSNWGNYHLTRMRGYLRPPVTGEYTFWIASDNSGELWLSSDKDPGKVKRIAYLKSGEWASQHGWSQYPWQRSEPILLDGGSSYYIEAFEEQLTLDDNLSVAWEGPGLSQSVIAGNYLSPYIENAGQSRFADTPGILWDYWTNYTAGNLEPITGSRPFQSAITARDVRLTVLGKGSRPQAEDILLDQTLRPEDNYRWVEIQGMVTFMGNGNGGASIELTDGKTRLQVHVADWTTNWPSKNKNWIARVEGVCEGVLNDDSQLVPGSIWVPSDRNILFIEDTNTDWSSIRGLSPYHFTAPVANIIGQTMGDFLSFLSVLGAVTFDDKVMGKDCLFVQDNATGIFISQSDFPWGAHLHVGQWVTFGGDLELGYYAPNLHPVLERTMGWRPLPTPVSDPVGPTTAPSRDGQWTELEGVVRSLNTNGTLLVMGKGGPVSVWIGHESAVDLGRYLDSTLRLRGVLSLTMWDGPMLLVPSPDFVEEEEQAPDPFKLPSLAITNLALLNTSNQWVHRVRIKGTIIYSADGSLFIEDSSGGIRVKTMGDPIAKTGDSVEAVGFPESDGGSMSLSDAIIRIITPQTAMLPRNIDLSGNEAARYDGTLIRAEATLLVQKSGDAGDLLELQEGQNIFEAATPPLTVKLPSFAPGSILGITGVCDARAGASPPVKSADENGSSSSILIRLRSPSDVVLLQPPPKGTLKKIAITMSALFVILLGALGRIYLSRRRLERQQATQSAFSRQILQSQESERSRIAANLHDSLGQSLLVIKNQVQLAMQSVKDEPMVQQRLDEISHIASQAVEEVRQITHDLRPYQLDHLGLAQAIRAIIKRAAENSPILIASHVDNIDGIFDKTSEIHVYRIVQEGLNNILKHSGAVEAAVVVKKQATIVSMSFRDNGRGFNIGLATPADPYIAGFGLGGIAERTKILRGKLTVESQPGKGTTLTIVIPLPATK